MTKKILLVLLFCCVFFVSTVFSANIDEKLFIAMEFNPESMRLVIPNKVDIKKLIKSGANPNFKLNQTSVLDHYVQLTAAYAKGTDYKKGIAVIEELLKNGAKPGKYTIEYPIRYNRKELVELLAKHKVDLTKWDIRKKMSPMEWADAHGANDVVQYLKSKGIKPVDAKLSRANKILIAVEWGTSVDLINMKLTADDLAGDNSEGVPPLYAVLSPATHEDTLIKVFYLLNLNKGQKLPNYVDEKLKESLLHRSVWLIDFEYDKYGQSTILKSLLDLGADLNSRDDYLGGTALHKATRLNKENAVKALLASNADMYARDKKGALPYDAAKSENIKQLFIDHGYQLPATVSTFEFRGHKFRMRSSSLTPVEDFARKHGLKYVPHYKSPNIVQMHDMKEKDTIGDARVSLINYFLFKNQLFRIQVMYEDKPPFLATSDIKAAIEAKYKINYRKSLFSDNPNYSVDVNNVNYQLSCNKSFIDNKYSCFLYFIDNELYKAAMQDESSFSKNAQLEIKENIKSDL